MSVPQRNINLDGREPIRIGQLNAQGSSACMDEIRNIAQDHKLNVMLIQEPYSRLGKIQNMAGVRIYYKCNDCKAAIFVFDQNIEVLYDRKLTNTHHVVIKLHKVQTVEPHLRTWDKVIQELGNNKVIFAGDVNSKSLYWFSDDTNMTGQAIEAFNSAT